MRRMVYQESASAMPGLDLLAGLLIIVCVLGSTYMLTQTIDRDINIALKSTVATVLITSGIMMRLLFVPGGLSVKPLDLNGLLVTVSGAALGLLLIVLVMVARTPMSVTPMEGRLFYANMAIAEEVFFNYFVFMWMASMYGPGVSALITGGVFSAYHMFVYAMNPSLLAFAFAARVVLCAVYWFTRNLSAPMIAHMIINIMVVG